MNEEKMRAEFEVAAKTAQGLDVTRLPHGGYRSFATHQAWWAWQASRAALAPAAKPRLTGANGGEFKFVAKWDGVDAHPDFEISNAVFDMAGKNHISDLLIAVSDWISEYAESIRTTTTRTDIIETADVRVKP